ncbi:MAG: TRAP transporter large permease [Intestinimonas sp.]|jgi:C4-dicarboxylate transporter DctM subunit|nr:TRAP transporter large permease [Intestinimonas sp.]
MAYAIFFGSMFLMLLIGVPIGIALAGSMVLLIFHTPVTSMTFISQAMYTGVGSFTLLALPFFIIAGSIMDTGGISKRLIRVANAVLGNTTGGLGMATILACMFFGAISGSAPATVAAIGGIMIPQMVRAGYDKYYAAGLCAVAGGLGIIVPPSYPLVVYGCTNNVSISDLFLAGWGPAVLVGGLLMVVNYIYAKKHGYEGTGVKFSMKNFLKELWNAKLAFLMPVIILGGIYSGIFTATEAAVVAVVYGIIVGKFIYKELDFKALWEMYKSNIPFLGGMMFVFAPAASLGAVFSMMGVTKAIQATILSVSSNIYIVMIIIFILLLIVGMFVQTTPAIVIFSPILLPVVTALGMDPVQFGLVMDLSLSIAFVTPPVAVNLFVATSMTGLDMLVIVKRAIPFLIAMLIAMFVVGYVPGVSMGLLNLFK